MNGQTKYVSVLFGIPNSEHSFIASLDIDLIDIKVELHRDRIN